jgi:glycosyltransferase involved in cell wall biosynthesis
VNPNGGTVAPLVTVLMPIYNGEAFVVDAVESILGQTFRDFEFLVIDDASTDRSVDILGGISDPRIRLVHNERRLELIRTLNRGLELARGKYIARMDADDVSLPTRLERQVGFMEANPEVGICGTWVVTMGEREGATRHYPETPDEIRCRLLFGAALAHPTVCMRREMLLRHGLRFDEGYPHAEDFELWNRASELFPLANLGSALLRYRIHAGSVSRLHHDVRAASVERIHRERLGRLGLTPTEEELVIHRQVVPGGATGEPPQLSRIRSWLEMLLRANEATGCYPTSAFERLLGKLWLSATYRTLAVGRPGLKEFFASPLARRVEIGERIRLLAHAKKQAVHRRFARDRAQD